MSALNSSAGKIVKQLIAKNGPMTNQKLFEYVQKYPEQLVSKTYLKQKVLKSLENTGVLEKKVNKNASSKPVWEWRFTNENDIGKYK